jgi:hypothetical protein
MKLLNRSSFFWLAIAILSTLVACNPGVSTILRYGNIGQTSFEQTLNFEVSRGLIILPVSIKGKSYRFLFDTGAPNSISKPLQNDFKFKVLSRGNIVDSEGKQSPTEFIGIDTIWIGGIPFIDQTAFVGDFEANPAINCLDIDGIIGSNLMRFCNWKIDMQNQQLTLSNVVLNDPENTPQSLDFIPSNQFDLLVNVQAGNATIKNLKIDYGSNGSLSVPDEIFKIVIEKNNIEETFEIFGRSQKGITGELNESKRKRAFLDTLKLNDFILTRATILSGGSGLIGTELLSKAAVIIDWSKQKLFFENVDTSPLDESTFGLKLGLSKANTLYVQSVTENSPAYDMGIVPDMQIIKIGDMDFTQNHTFCDYLFFDVTPETLSVVLKNAEGKTQEYVLTKRTLSSKY